MEPTNHLLTVAERERYAAYVEPHPIEAHQREALAARAQAFPRLLSAYTALDSSLAEAQGEFEEMARRQDSLSAQLAEARQELADQEAKATARVATLLAEFVAGIQPADIPGCLKMHSEPAFGEFLRGMNAVHGTNLRWARWKAAEFGLPWPLPAAEFEFGYTNEAGQPLPTPKQAAPYPYRERQGRC
jgi:hypothetical protein